MHFNSSQLQLIDKNDRLIKQIDHYFSNYNLQSCNYLRKKLLDPGYITLNELITFKQISNIPLEFLRSVLVSEQFEFASFDPETERITRRKENPFLFDSYFWRNRARLSLYLLCFPDQFDPVLIQQKIPGVVFVRLVKDVQKNIFSIDDSSSYLDDSFNSLKNDSVSTEKDSIENGESKRKPHAILYFEDEESMNEIVKLCGPNDEFYFDNNNHKCYIRARRKDNFLSPKQHNKYSLSNVARARTMVWFTDLYKDKKDFEIIKNLFHDDGVILCFFASNSWLLFFKSNLDFRQFQSKLEIHSGHFQSLQELWGDDVSNYSAYLKVLRNFYQKSR